MMNKQEYSFFKDICGLTQKEVFKFMSAFLRKLYPKEKVITTSNYIVAFGDIPVGIVAHADTVFPKPPTKFYYDKEESILWSPQGLGADDRAGIYLIVKLLRETDLRPHIIITANEEQGAVGARHLIMEMPTFPANFLIQLDRRGENDSVYYDCANEDFEKFINNYGFQTNFGTFTDISFLCSCWGMAGVNLSVGYENEHTYGETLNTKHLSRTYEKLIKILRTKELPYFEYIEQKRELYYKNAMVDDFYW